MSSLSQISPATILHSFTHATENRRSLVKIAALISLVTSVALIAFGFVKAGLVFAAATACLLIYHFVHLVLERCFNTAVNVTAAATVAVATIATVTSVVTIAAIADAAADDRSDAHTSTPATIRVQQLFRTYSARPFQAARTYLWNAVYPVSGLSK